MATLTEPVDLVRSGSRPSRSNGRLGLFGGFGSPERCWPRRRAMVARRCEAARWLWDTAEQGKGMGTRSEARQTREGASRRRWLAGGEVCAVVLHWSRPGARWSMAQRHYGLGWYTESRGTQSAASRIRPGCLHCPLVTGDGIECDGAAHVRRRSGKGAEGFLTSP